MANSKCEVPDDWWGLSKKEVKKAVGNHARLTNETFEYDGAKADFEIKDIGRYRIVAKSQKELRRALCSIRDTRWKKERPQDWDISKKHKKIGRPGGCL